MTFINIVSCGQPYHQKNDNNTFFFFQVQFKKILFIYLQTENNLWQINYAISISATSPENSNTHKWKSCLSAEHFFSLFLILKCYTQKHRHYTHFSVDPLSKTWPNDWTSDFRFFCFCFFYFFFIFFPLFTFHFFFYFEELLAWTGIEMLFSWSYINCPLPQTHTQQIDN